MDQFDTYNFADWVPSIETLTFNVRSTSGNSDAVFTGYSLQEAQRKKLHKEFVDGKAVTRITWELFLRGLQNATLVVGGTPAVAPSPKKGDELVDSVGVTYVIDTVPEAKLFGNVWHCDCKVQVPVVDAVGA